jgi:hypothetical protein
MLRALAPFPNGPWTSNTRRDGANNVGSCSRHASSSRVSCRSIPNRDMHQAIRPGAMRVARENAAAVPLIVISGRPLTTACQIPWATTSGW